MRITANIRDEALDLARRKAAERGVSLGEILSEAVLSTYRSRPARRQRVIYDLPTSGSGGLQAGVELDSWAVLEDQMAGQT